MAHQVNFRPTHSAHGPLPTHSPMGSAHPYGSLIGAGIFELKTSQYQAWNLGSELEVFDAKLFAIDRALLKAIKVSTKETPKSTQEFLFNYTPIKKEIWVFVDSQAAIQRL
ncbi:hypothetical protein TMEN_7634 [Trichophyton mentagrophytes]|nr:hypothetical protein TMEN_7634 [Trichophyton mentagrophytes]